LDDKTVIDKDSELEKRLTQLIEANERVAEVYRIEAQKALNVALDNLMKHLASMNEFRESNNDAFNKFREIINDLTIKMLTRVEYKEAHDILIKLIDTLRLSLEAHKSEATGSRNLMTYIFAALAVLFAAVTAADKLIY
jgi:hypothetical protein